MLLSSLTALITVLPIAVLGGQFPAYGNFHRRGSPSIIELNARQSVANNTPIEPGTLRYVENTGICETTPGVYSASGYADLDGGVHYFFWYFAARENPDTAPLTIWLTGGPGSSSMVGLFNEHGPCLMNNDSSTIRFNPQSWNNNSNMLYVDQPVGTGFSYGEATTGRSTEVAKYLWELIQAILSDEKFKEFRGREFVIACESYGGHYGPITASYFIDQNNAIAAGTSLDIPVNLTTLVIGNGFFDAITQYPGYISYAKTNPYLQLVDDLTIELANASYYHPGGCRDQIIQCNNNGTDYTCALAQYTCNDGIWNVLYGSRNAYYVINDRTDTYPPDISAWLNNRTSSIGATGTWIISNQTVYENFWRDGDWIRSSKPYLENVINEGIRTYLYVGDADYLCNYQGVENMIDSLDHKYSVEYASTNWTTWTVDGVIAGQFKNAGIFSYVRIYEAGHEVPAYTVGDLPYGRHARTLFTQAIANEPISST